MDERGQQFAQHVGMRSGESFSQHLGPVDIVGSGHRVYSFARVTLDGLSKNHAMTFIYPATTRRPSRPGPARTPLCWTQPGRVQLIAAVDPGEPVVFLDGNINGKGEITRYTEDVLDSERR